MGWLGGLAGRQGGLGVVWTDFTIRELSGIWLAGLGWPGWQGQMGENFGIQ